MPGEPAVPGGGLGVFATESVVLKLGEGRLPSHNLTWRSSTNPGRIGPAVAASIVDALEYDGRRHFAKVAAEVAIRFARGEGRAGTGTALLVLNTALDWELTAKRKLQHNQQRVCACEAALSDVDQPALGRQCHGLRAPNGVELFQNSRHVIFHGVLTDVEHLPDFLIAFAKGHLLQHLKFALG